MPDPPRCRFVESIHQPGRRVRVCEPRLALSASGTADLLLSALQQDVLDASDGDWLLDHAQAVRQQYGIDGAGQTIAVIDSGVAWDHVALGGGFGPGYRVVGGWDFAEDDADPYDDGPAGFHGTHVSGLIAGHSEGFSGIAPGADLVALRVFDDTGQGSLDQIESALRWVHTHRDALVHPITTVNLSLGALLSDEMSGQVLGQLEDELQLLRDDGVVVVAAAGNGFHPADPDRLNYPAASPWVAAVGSVDASSSALSSFSQRESGILVAPGQNIRSSVPDHVLGWDGRVDDFVAATGTSMAAPQLAGAAALVRQAMIAAGADPGPETILQHLHDTATSQIDQVSGMAYDLVDLQRAIESLLGGEPDAGPDPADPGSDDPPADDPPADVLALGRVDALQVSLQAGQWYRIEPSRSGILSLQLGGEQRAELTVRDADGATMLPLPSGDAGQSDFAVTAEQSLLVRLQGAGPFPVRLTNLVSIESGRIDVAGTDGGDTIRMDLTDGVQIHVHGARYGIDTTRPAGWSAAGDAAMPSAAAMQIRIDGGSGSDHLQVVGSADAERLLLRPAATDHHATGNLTTAAMEAQLRGLETVHFSGGGGSDRATLYDGAGADTLQSHPGQAQLSGAGYAFTVDQVPRIFVHATAGGEDTAFLYDSAGDDVLAVRPQFTSLRGGDHFNLAYGFERVYAYATDGGRDRADLYDSAGDDAMTAAPTAAWISGSGYYASARHFETVVGHATAGGNDRAALYAEADAALWTRTSDLVQMNQGGHLRAARGFEQADTFLAGQPIQVAPLVWSPRGSRPTDGPDDEPDAAQGEAAILADLFARLGDR